MEVDANGVKPPVPRTLPDDCGPRGGRRRGDAAPAWAHLKLGLCDHEINHSNAVAAHGGLDRWNQVKSITVDASITGALWSLESKGDALNDVRFEVDTTRERLTMDFAGQDKRSVFEPHRVVMQRRDGTLIDARDDPERSFDGHQLQTRGTTFISPISPGRRCGHI
jgi:hypothetical protein